MTLARIVFEKKKLAARYGVEGRVAGRYVEAGYHVRMGVETRKGRVSFIASKAGVKLAVVVVEKPGLLGRSLVEEVAERAKLLGAKPVLVLYGSGPRLTDDALAAAKELGVVLKRVRG